MKDFASIKKYAPRDIAIWQEWLVYGTALGVGNVVVKAMKVLNIYTPELHAVEKRNLVEGLWRGRDSAEEAVERGRVTR